MFTSNKVVMEATSSSGVYFNLLTAVREYDGKVIHEDNGMGICGDKSAEWKFPDGSVVRAHWFDSGYGPYDDEITIVAS